MYVTKHTRTLYPRPQLPHNVSLPLRDLRCCRSYLRTAQFHRGLKPVVFLQNDPSDSHFGKEHIPTSFPKIQPVFNTAWRKKSGFDQLASTIHGLLKSHSVADTIPLISCKVPIETFIEQQEASKFIHKVRRSVFDVNHLQAIEFLDVSGKNVNIKSDKLNDRPSELTFFQFSCGIDSVDSEPCICHKKSTFSYVPPFPNTSIMSPPGSLRPSALPANTPKIPIGVRVGWLPSSEAHKLLEIASVLIF